MANRRCTYVYLRGPNKDRRCSHYPQQHYLVPGQPPLCAAHRVRRGCTHTAARAALLGCDAPVGRAECGRRTRSMYGRCTAHPLRWPEMPAAEARTIYRRRVAEMALAAELRASAASAAPFPLSCLRL